MDMIDELSICEQAHQTTQDDPDSVLAVSMTESDIGKLMQWEHTNICSDGTDGGGHPRGYGSFPRVLAHYVRTKGALDLASAVHKMTGLSADHMGIQDRGTVAQGMAADLVLFDPERIKDKATIKDPMRRSEGIVKVWVNGQVVYTDGKTTGTLPGKVVRRIFE